MQARPGLLSLRTAGAVVGAVLTLPLCSAEGGGPAQTVLHVTPAGSDRGACTAAEPCRTLAAAYQRARPGATIVVGAGTYPQQHVLRSAKPSTPAVTIRPEPGRSVRVLGIQLGDPGTGNGPHGLVLSDLMLPGHEVEVFEGAEDITIDSARAADFYIRGATHVRILGGSYGPCLTDGHNPNCGNSKIDTPEPPWRTDDILVSGVAFHDYRIVQGSGAHFECLFVRGGTRVVIVDSSFRRCEFFDLFVQWSGTPIDDLRVQRNRFEPTYDGNKGLRDIALMLSGGGYVWRNIGIVQNAFVDSQPILDDGTNGGYANVVVGGNLLPTRLTCEPGVTYRGNLAPAGGCDASDRTRIFGYRLTMGSLVPRGEEADAVRTAFVSASRGAAVAAIAAAARTAGRPSPPGGWTAQSVRALLTDATYRGVQPGPARAARPLVSRALWLAAQATARAG